MEGILQTIFNLPEKQREVLLTAIYAREDLPVPDNSIDVTKNMGSFTEQVAGANIKFGINKDVGGIADEGGDCVMSMIFKLKEMSEKFGDSVKSHTIINPVMVMGFKEEEFVIHHIIQDKKRNIWIDVSNGRLRMCHPNIYRNQCLPPIIEEKEDGFTYPELQQQTKDWVKKIIKKNVAKPNPALVYLYFQTSIHNPMMNEYNPKGDMGMYLSKKELKKLLPLVLRMSPIDCIRFLHHKDI